MSRMCTICIHENRHDIEACIANGDANSKVAKRFGTSASAVLRHKGNCGLVRMDQRTERWRSRVDIVGNLVVLASEACADHKNAREAESHMAVAALHGRRKDLLMAISEMQGPEDANAGELSKHPGFAAMRDAILAALEPFPEAKQALMRTLSPRTGGDSR